MRWGVEQRLAFIEFRLFWEGAINRSDLMKEFGISVPQASKDLSLYQERAPGNMSYDRKEKRYLAEPRFVLRFLDPDPYIYLSQLKSVAEGAPTISESWIGVLPIADVTVAPKRRIDIEVLRRVLRAIRERHSVEVLYQSMNARSPEPVWRRITPHAFGFDGFRWHVRAYCHLEDAFRDFLLPRILEAASFGEAGATPAADWQWNKFIEIILVAHPKLTDAQQAVVAMDYGFYDGSGHLQVRQAMLYYAMKSLGLLHNPESVDPRRQHVIASNQRALQEALKEAEHHAS